MATEGWMKLQGLISQQCQCNPANESQGAGRYNTDAGKNHDRRPQACGWNRLLLRRVVDCHRFAPVLVPENKLGISKHEPKPERRHDNQGCRRDKTPEAIFRHRPTIS
jgi:hypothetical protein